MLVAAPIGFFIWSFRNADRKKDLQRAQEELRQVEFHKILEWAAAVPSITTQHGATPTSKGDSIVIDEKKTSILQTTAIHVLIPFLKQEKGERFSRPAMVIYRRLLSSWDPDEQTLIKHKDKTEKPIYIAELHNILSEEIESLSKMNNSWFPFEEIDLKGINLEKKILKNINFKKASFVGANLEGASFDDADLTGATLEGANIKGTSFKNATLRGVVLTNVEFDENTSLETAKELEDIIIVDTPEDLKDFIRSRLKDTNLPDSLVTDSELENINDQARIWRFKKKN